MEARIPTASDIGLPTWVDPDKPPQETLPPVLHSFLHTFLLLLDTLTNTARIPGELEQMGWAHEGDQYVQHMSNLAATMMVSANQLRDVQVRVSLTPPRMFISSSIQDPSPLYPPLLPYSPPPPSPLSLSPSPSLLFSSYPPCEAPSRKTKSLTSIQGGSHSHLASRAGTDLEKGADFSPEDVSILLRYSLRRSRA